MTMGIVSVNPGGLAWMPVTPDLDTVQEPHSPWSAVPVGRELLSGSSPPSSTQGPSWICCTPEGTNPTGPRGARGQASGSAGCGLSPSSQQSMAFFLTAPAATSRPAQSSSRPAVLEARVCSPFQRPPPTSTNSRSQVLSPTLCPRGQHTKARGADTCGSQHDPPPHPRAQSGPNVRAQGWRTPTH